MNKIIQSDIVQCGAIAIGFAFALFLFNSPLNDAKAGVGVSVTPDFPSTVTVGDTDVAVTLGITNNSNSGDGNPLTLNSIKLIPSCGAIGAGCTTLDPGVFSVDVNGTGAGSCAANTFTITETNGASGEVTFTPNAAIALTPAQTCTINFTVDVVGSPDSDASVAAGKQTLQLGSVSGVDQNQNPGTGSGSDQLTVISALVVEKTAEGTFDRDWTWEIEKTTTDGTEIEIAEGQSYVVNYNVEVDATEIDSNHYVAGTITITNPAGNPTATIDEEADIVDELDTGEIMDIDCETAGYPVNLPAGSSLVCTYGGAADADAEDNTVTVTTSGSVPGGEATEEIDWANSPTIETDECVTVNDTNPEGPQNVIVCENQLPEDWDYEVTFGPEGGEDTDVVVICGDNTYENTADLVTNDNDETDEASLTIDVTVSCVTGCTLTQGYWKTHNDSFKGGAPTDDGWEELAGGLKETTPFFTSGLTWFKVFNTPPKGNAWYNLAHQYMAAKLNILNGAGAPAGVATAITNAEALFNHVNYNTPEEFAALGKKAQIRKNAITWAGILGAFNEGQTGPGHCDEDETSAN